MEHIYDTIILGGGPAGYTAALYAARSGLDVVLLERMTEGGQMVLTGQIDNYPGFPEGIDGFQLAARMRQGAEAFGAKTEYAEVSAVELSGSVKKVVTADGVYWGKTVVIATGANPRTLGLGGEEELTGRGVHYCAHCDGRFYRDKTVVVVGGGNSAVGDALYLAKLAKKVYLIHRRDTLRAAKIYREALENTANVEILWNSAVTQWIAENSLTGVQVKNLLTGQMTELSCDGVFVSVGRIPATGFLTGALALDAHGYILADESTKTSLDGVYAAGDVRVKALRQIITAAADGAAAAHAAQEFLSGTEI